VRRFLVLSRRELFSYLVTPPLWIVTAIFLLVNGLSIYQAMVQTSGDVTATHSFLFGGFFFWFLVILLPAAFTSRLFALERASGTLETLMTAPVSDVEVVLSKFGAALALFALQWAPTIVYYVMFQRSGGAPDRGPIAASYLGTFGIGALFTALGCLASSLATSQTIAFFGAAMGSATLLVAPVVAAGARSDFVLSIARYVSLPEHVEEFGRGVVDPRRFVFYASGAALFLFLTVRSVESRKWR
jgi:gliding motility-associated transport system permease protein